MGRQDEGHPKGFEDRSGLEWTVELNQALMTDITIMNGQLRFTTGCDEWTVDGDAEKFGALLRGFEDVGKMKGFGMDGKTRKDLEWMGRASKKGFEG
ncbi:hypothetical protein HPP92_022619 [Vanilla planifolia]|uniref:Uncharacterized protein n=1 Tax=Vanilla planifolia TaxID=51239 RepID=A0A835PPD4_VANPL|nr:hypothetical protein HPP92_022903 [Vanilla planifolia]KAG0459491.1 hypothetical protein HPP92_022619 [Vanilla planifolia]